MKTRKIVINEAYGGFALSENAEVLYKWVKSIPLQKIIFSIPRDDSVLVKIVEVWEDKANGSCAILKIVKIPYNVKWIIVEDETGIEHVAEQHRTWR